MACAIQKNPLEPRPPGAINNKTRVPSSKVSNTPESQLSIGANSKRCCPMSTACRPEIKYRGAASHFAARIFESCRPSSLDGYARGPRHSQTLPRENHHVAQSSMLPRLPCCAGRPDRHGPRARANKDIERPGMHQRLLFHLRPLTADGAASSRFLGRACQVDNHRNLDDDLHERRPGPHRVGVLL